MLACARQKKREKRVLTDGGALTAGGGYRRRRGSRGARLHRAAVHKGALTQRGRGRGRYRAALLLVRGRDRGFPEGCAGHDAENGRYPWPGRVVRVRCRSCCRQRVLVNSTGGVEPSIEFYHAESSWD